MNKLLLALPVAVGVAGASWAGTTAWAGAESRDAYDALVRDLAAQGGGLSVVSTGYEPGFLESRATTEVRAVHGGQTRTVARLEHVVEHSPVGLGDGARLGASRIVTTLDPAAFPDAARDALAGFDGAEPLTLVTIVGPGGASTNELALAPWTGVLDGVALASREGVWDFTIDAERRMVGTGRFGGLDVEAPDTTMRVGPIEDRFDYSLAAGDGLPDGSYAMSVSSLAYEYPEAYLNTEMSGIELSADSRTVDGRLGVDTALDVARIDAPAPIAGSVERVSLSVAVRDLDAEAYRRYSNAAYASPLLGMGGERMAMAAEVDPDALLADARNLLGAMLDTVVPGTGIDLALTLGNAGGTADAALSLDFAGDGSPDGRAGMRTVGDLVAALEARATVGVDDAALAMTPAAMLVDPAMLGPWASREAGRWTSEATLSDLSLDVNGNEIPLATMMAGPMDAPLAWPAPSRD